MKVFEEWNKTELDSFLIEITKDILAFKDSDGTPLVEKIRDSAGQVRILCTGHHRLFLNEGYTFPGTERMAGLRWPWRAMGKNDSKQLCI